jgi:hypothetical protein
MKCASGVFVRNNKGILIPVISRRSNEKVQFYAPKWLCRPIITFSPENLIRNLPQITSFTHALLKHAFAYMHTFYIGNNVCYSFETWVFCL